MTIENGILEYDFHDSNIVELNFSEGNLWIKIDLCMWKQKNYRNDIPELKEIMLIFQGVSNYTWESEKSELEIDYDIMILGSKPQLYLPLLL